MIKKITFLALVTLAFTLQVSVANAAFPNQQAVVGTVGPGSGMAAPGGSYNYCVVNAGRGAGDLFRCGNNICAKESTNSNTFCVVNYRQCLRNEMNNGQGFGTPFRCFAEVETTLFTNGSISASTIDDGPAMWCGKTDPDALDQDTNYCVSLNQNLSATASGTGADVTPSGTATATTSVGTFGFDKLENPLAGAGVSSLSGAIGKVLGLILRIAIPFVTLMLIYTGFLFVRAQGDPGKLKEAKTTFVSVIIGAALLMGCAIIANTIANTIEKVGKAAGSGGSSSTSVVSQPATGK